MGKEDLVQLHNQAPLSHFKVYHEVVKWEGAVVCGKFSAQCLVMKNLPQPKHAPTGNSCFFSLNDPPSKG